MDMELDKYKISDNQVIEQAIEIIEWNSSRCAVVVNNQNKVVGIISEGDILRAILKGINIKSPVRNIMNAGFKFVLNKEDEKVISFLKQGITLIPVLNEENHLVGIISYQDYLK